MSWATDLYCRVSFNRATYNNKYEVDNRMEELNKCINQCKKELRDLAFITEPNKFFSKEEDYSPYTFVEQKLEDNLELLEDYIGERNDLSLLLENWNKCHNADGLAIPPPDNFKWDSAFMDGDFVKTINHPNGEDY